MCEGEHPSFYGGRSKLAQHTNARERERNIDTIGGTSASSATLVSASKVLRLPPTTPSGDTARCCHRNDEFHQLVKAEHRHRIKNKLVKQTALQILFRPNLARCMLSKRCIHNQTIEWAPVSRSSTSGTSSWVAC